MVFTNKYSRSKIKIFTIILYHDHKFMTKYLPSYCVMITSSCLNTTKSKTLERDGRMV